MTQFTNNLKTTVLLALMFGLIVGIGSFFGQQGLIIALIFGGLMNVIAFFFSDKIALAAMHGQEVDEQSAPDLIAMIRRLSQNAGLPMPRVYICPQDAPNAFATGRSPRKAAVAVTQGALKLLSYDELEGVMAHELAHVKNRDTLTSCIAASIAGAISYLAHMMLWFGPRRDSQESSPAGAIGMILAVILAPIAAALIQLAISRSREYVADADGAKIAGTPLGLANALRKLHSMNHQVPMEHQMPAFNHLFIVQPLNAREALSSLFSTHPPMEKRIEKLMAIA